MDTTLGNRIVAARVVAGYTALVDVAHRLGMHKVKYQKLEAGNVKLNAVDAENAAKLFTVSKDFLLDGKVSNGRELLISHIAKHLADHAGKYADAAMRERLVQARQTAGFASGRAAADNFGWKPQTLGAHERGSANLSIERLIGYGLAYRTNPEYLLYSEPPMEMSEIPGVKHWSDVRGSMEKAKPTDAVSWRWLSRQTKSGVATIALMNTDPHGLKKSGLAPIVLPASMISAKFVSPYGILQPHDDGKKIILVVDPSISTGDAVLLDDGVVRVVPSLDAGDRIVVDPIAAGPAVLKDFYLGSLLAKVCIG